MAGVSGTKRLPPKLPPNTFRGRASDVPAVGPRGFASTYALGSSQSIARLTSTRIGMSAAVPIFAHGDGSAPEFFTYSPEETGLKIWLRANTELDAVVQTMQSAERYESSTDGEHPVINAEKDLLRALVKALRRHFNLTTGFATIEDPQRQIARAWIADAHRLSNRLQLNIQKKPFLHWLTVDRFFDVQERVARTWKWQCQLTQVEKKNREWVNLVDGPPARDRDGNTIWMSGWHRIESGLTGIVKPDQGRIAQWLTPDGLADLLMAAQSVDVANGFLLAISSIALTGRKPNVAMPSGVAKAPFPGFFDGLDSPHQTFSFGTTPAFLGRLLRGFQEKAEIVLDRWAATAGILTPWCRDRTELGQKRMHLVGEDRQRMQDVIELHYQRISAAIAGAGDGYRPAYVGPASDRIWRDFGKRAAIEALVTLLIARGFVSPSFRESYVQFIGARASEEARKGRDGFNGRVRRLIATSASASNIDMKERLSDLGIIPPPHMIPDHDHHDAITRGGDLLHLPVRPLRPAAPSAAASQVQGAKVYIFPSRTPTLPPAA